MIPATMSYSLTPRELEVVRLIMHGLSAKEAARNLNISPSCVVQYTTNVMIKTRTKNRTHMVAHLMEKGVI